MAFLKCLKAAAIKILKITEGATKYYTLQAISGAQISDIADGIKIVIPSGASTSINNIDVTGYTKLYINISCATNSNCRIRLSNGEETGYITKTTPSLVNVSLTGLTGTMNLQLLFPITDTYRIYEMYLSND